MSKLQSKSTARLIYEALQGMFKIIAHLKVSMVTANTWGETLDEQTKQLTSAHTRLLGQSILGDSSLQSHQSICMRGC